MINSNKETKAFESINSILINFAKLSLPIAPSKHLLAMGLHFLFPTKAQYDKQAKEYLSNKHSRQYDIESIASMMVRKQKTYMRHQLEREIRRRGTYTNVDGVPM